MILAQHDAHLAPWLLSWYGLTVVQNANYGFDAWMGDYDLDDECTRDDATIFAAAQEWANCYDGRLFDEPCCIEAGETF